MDKIAIKYDKQLTKSAKAIFGNIIKKAYYTTSHYRDDSKAVIRERIKLDKNDSEGSDGFIDIGSKIIWIQFITGKMVELSSSEWGSIGLADIDKSYEVE